ncbi:MAG: hemolysin [Bacteroidetes bacterium]|nr:hemolysin [Bacteroidota bacterium]
MMNNWIIVVITLLLSGFFSGIEIAFISSNRLKIELDKSRGTFTGKLISFFIKNPSRFIGALLLGNNIALVIYGIAMTKILEPWLFEILPLDLQGDILILLTQTLIATVIILFTAEFIPKIVFRIQPNAILRFFAIPIAVFYIILFIFVWIYLGISKFILKYILRVKFKSEKYSFSFSDLHDYFTEFTGNGDTDHVEIQQEIQIFQNAIDFRNVKLRECMIPRTDIIALEDKDSIEDIRKLFVKTGHSKILIYTESIDNVIGYVHSYDLFHKPESINEVLRPIVIVPETMLANKVLSMLIKEHKSVAVVVDEFGGTSGMITMEDIIEEIFGEIEDEHDVEDAIDKQISETEFQFSGRMEIDYLNDKYEFNIPESEEYETLAGFILYHHESIPEIDEEIKIDKFTFIIQQAVENRIESVYMSIKH